MSLSIGIVGLPNVGKSTLFNALTRKSVPAENYPFCTIDPSVGIVAVPDERVQKLTDFSKSAKSIPAVIEFVDIAGLVQGAASGEGLGNKFLQHIREVDAIAEVVRVFEDSSITHVHGTPKPTHDVEVINLELILADLELVTKRLNHASRSARSGDKEALIEEGLLQKIRPTLEAGKLASSTAVEEKEQKVYRDLHLLSAKPILYVLNSKAGAAKVDPSTLINLVKATGASYVEVDAGIEAELSAFEGAEKEAFRHELLATPTYPHTEGSPLYVDKSDGVNELIKQSYELLGLHTYFTTGPDETRAWTIKKGWTAPEAGAAIHNDFKEKFIRAEVVHCDDLLTASSYARAREQGLVRTEGKEYVVKDGDVIEFRI